MNTEILQTFAGYLSQIGLQKNSIDDEIHYIRFAYMELGFNEINGKDDPLKLTEDKEVETLVQNLAKGRPWKAAWQLPSTHKCRHALKRFYYWAYEWEKLCSGRTPYQTFYCRKGEKKEPKFLIEEKIEKIYCNPFLRMSDVLLVRLFYISGLRLSDMQRLNVEDFDAHTNMLHIKKSKREKWRWVKIDVKTAVFLKVYIHSLKIQGHGAPADPMFPSQYTWRRMAAHRMSRRIVKAGEMVGIDVYPQMLRHSTARGILLNGGTLGHVQRHLGHASPSQTLQYTHMVEEDLGPVLENMA